MSSDAKRVRARVLEMARRDERKGDWKSALRRYRRLTGLEPGQPTLHIKLGDVCLHLGHERDAADAFFTAGLLFTKAAFDEKAAALYKRALEFAPERKDVRDALVEAYRRLDRMKDAAAMLEQASERMAREGARREALELRRQIARLDPLDVDARLRLARDLEACGERDEAVQEYAESLLELLRQGVFERARGVLDTILALRPTERTASAEDVGAEPEELVEHAREARAHFESVQELYRRAAALYEQGHAP